MRKTHFSRCGQMRDKARITRHALNYARKFLYIFSIVPIPFSIFFFFFSIPSCGDFFCFQRNGPPFSRKKDIAMLSENLLTLFRYIKRNHLAESCKEAPSFIDIDYRFKRIVC